MGVRDANESPSLPSAPKKGLLWSVMLLLGFLLYEWTAQPALGIVVVCSKIGWKDFRTGFWLLQTDPRRSRGWANGCLYLASGTWNTLLLGLALIPLLCFLFLFVLQLLGWQKRWEEYL